MYVSIWVFEEQEVFEGVVEFGIWFCIGVVFEEGLGGVVDEVLY